MTCSSLGRWGAAATVTCVAVATVWATASRADHQGHGSVLAKGEGASARVLGQTIRVLLFETDQVVRVRLSPAAPWIEIAAGAGGVRVDGGPPAPHWRGRARDTIWIDQLEVRGEIEIRPRGNGLAVVNELPLESYLAGSLGREMYASWAAAALRAQAVASRTYALYRVALARRTGSADFDLTAGTGSQVYGGVAAESHWIRDALEATRGQILRYAGAPILAAFHSASGGVTASSEEVWGEPHAYLVSQRVEGEDDSPDTYWRAAITRTTLGRAVAGLGIRLGEIRKLRVAARTASGRVDLLRATGTLATAEITGRELRRALGEATLRSTLFEIRRSEDGFVFVGSGRGHGVGMSQWGARALAERGETYKQILRTFYPGAELGGAELGEAELGRAPVGRLARRAERRGAGRGDVEMSGQLGNLSAAAGSRPSAATGRTGQ